MDRLHSRRDHARTGETAVHQPTPTSASQPGSFQAVTTSPRKQHDLVFDVGLHKGEDTEFYLEKGFRVVAFEADPDLAAHCRERFAAQLREGRLVIVEGAIVATTPGIDAPRTVTFYKNLDKSVWGTTQAAWADRNARLGTRVQQPLRTQAAARGGEAGRSKDPGVVRHACAVGRSTMMHADGTRPRRRRHEASA